MISSSIQKEITLNKLWNKIYDKRDEIDTFFASEDEEGNLSYDLKGEKNLIGLCLSYVLKLLEDEKKYIMAEKIDTLALLSYFSLICDKNYDPLKRTEYIELIKNQCLKEMLIYKKTLIGLSRSLTMKNKRQIIAFYKCFSFIQYMLIFRIMENNNWKED